MISGGVVRAVCITAGGADGAHTGRGVGQHGDGPSQDGGQPPGVCNSDGIGHRAGLRQRASSGCSPGGRQAGDGQGIALDRRPVFPTGRRDGLQAALGLHVGSIGICIPGSVRKRHRGRRGRAGRHGCRKAIRLAAQGRITAVCGDGQGTHAGSSIGDIVGQFQGRRPGNGRRARLC